ncbi:hypothetical protein ACF08W_31520 [Streptomyces sp. NPDC015144]|uniref:hypothetical protein n=1 Tax=Streptomyces sp. NPDC015144 TaxID=3364944 RepID=UPI0036FA245D
MTSMTCAPLAPASTTASLASTAAPLHAGVIEEIGREDDRGGHDGRGYERDETDTAFRQLVQHLVDHGDARAQKADRHARRTYADMVPGDYARQPVLHLTSPLDYRSADDACVICGFWTCKCGGIAPAQKADRRAGRTYAEMSPGPSYTCQPVLRMTTTSITFTPSAQPAPHGNGRMQCDRCNGWFGVTAWTCDACRAAGR